MLRLRLGCWPLHIFAHFMNYAENEHRIAQFVKWAISRMGCNTDMKMSVAQEDGELKYCQQCGGLIMDYQ
jgi:rRNA maturation endonuclease Nob1